MKTKINSVKSYIKVSLFGSYAEAFINSAIKKGIKIWNVENKDGFVFLNCYPRNYPYISKAARSYGLRTKVINRRGIYFFLRRYKKRYGAILGAFSFAFIIVLLSNFIWDIKVSGNETVTSTQIIEQLEKNGITIGNYIHDFNASAAELSLKLSLDRLAWVSIERDGSRINAKVSESLEEKKQNIPVSEPCNVVASKTGRIITFEVYRGNLLFEKGSGVNRGDIIVSGIVEDGAGNNLLSHADAKIIAECEDLAEFYAPFTVIEKKKTGVINKKDYIVFLGNIFPLFVNNVGTENVYYSEEMKNPDIFGFKLPFRIKTGIYEYYDEIEVTYSQEETLERLNKQLENYKTNFFGNDEIVDVSTEYIPDELGITVKIKVVYRTNIAVQKAISRG